MTAISGLLVTANECSCESCEKMSSHEPFAGKDYQDFKVLTLLITNKMIAGINRDTNVKFEARRIKVIGEGEQYELKRFKTLTKVYGQLRVLFQLEGTNKYQVINLSKECESIVLKLLQEGRPFQDYNCLAFFEDALGISSIRDYKWRKENFVEKELTTNDGVVICNKNKTPIHFAIYLTNSVYLSIGGTAGPLVAMSMNDMSKSNDGAAAYKITPTGPKINSSHSLFIRVISWIKQNALDPCLRPYRVTSPILDTN